MQNDHSSGLVLLSWVFLDSFWSALGRNVGVIAIMGKEYCIPGSLPCSTCCRSQ